MSRYSQMSKVAKSGAVDSKYFSNIDRFEQDIQEKIEKTDNFKSKIRELIIENPNLIEQRYHNVIEVMLEIKKEFNI